MGRKNHAGMERFFTPPQKSRKNKINQKEARQSHKSHDQTPPLEEKKNKKRRTIYIYLSPRKREILGHDNKKRQQKTTRHTHNKM